MNAIEHGQEPAGAAGYASDVTKKANFYIWAYFLAFGVMLYVMVSAVNLYFRMETEKEEFTKVGSLPSQELIDLRAHEAQVLSGKIGILEGKKNVSITDAINRVLKVAQ